MSVESGLEAAEFDLAVTPLRELNQRLHDVARDGGPAHWRIVSPDSVTVWPNMIWPTSMEMFRLSFTASAMRAAPEENLRSPSVP